MSRLNEMLLGELKEFKEYAKKEFSVIHENFSQMKLQVDSFSAFKWKLTGAAALAAFIATLVIELIKR